MYVVAKPPRLVRAPKPVVISKPVVEAPTRPKSGRGVRVPRVVVSGAKTGGKSGYDSIKVGTRN